MFYLPQDTKYKNHRLISDYSCLRLITMNEIIIRKKANKKTKKSVQHQGSEVYSNIRQKIFFNITNFLVETLLYASICIGISHV